MAVQLPSVVHKVNLFADGRGYAGMLNEFTPPKLTLKTEEYRSGGLDLPVEVDLGMEKLEVGFVVAGADADLFASFGLLGVDGVPLTGRAGLKRQGASEIVPVVFTMRGLFREIDLGTWKGGEVNTTTVAGALTYYTLTIGGVERVKIDALNLVRRIDGVDQLAGLRDAIGV